MERLILQIMLMHVVMNTVLKMKFRDSLARKVDHLKTSQTNYTKTPKRTFSKGFLNQANIFPN